MISFAPLELDAVAFLEQRTGLDFSAADFEQPKWLCVTARRPDGALQGVLACEFKQWFNVHLTMAIDDIFCVSPKVLFAIFRTLFSRARRITALVPTDNERSLKQIHLLGFQYEGFMRLGFDGQRDALLFGMLANECRWLSRARRRILIAGGHHG